MRLSIRLFSALAVLAIVTMAGLVTLAYRLDIPGSAAGMAAHQACSGVFVAGRKTDDVITRDIVPVNIIMRAASVSVDKRLQQVSASLPGTGERYAIYRNNLGCTLLAASALPPPEGVDRAPWPDGDNKNLLSDPDSNRDDLPLEKPIAAEAWPATVDQKALREVVQEAFEGPGSSSINPTHNDLSGQNTRSVVVVHQGRMLLERYAEGFDKNTPQLGWSMSKTLLSALVWKRLKDTGVSLDTPVVQLMQRVPRPQWIGPWLGDARADITIGQLLTMRDGLDHVESYMPWSDVPRMLWSTANIAAYAGSAEIKNEPGSQWRYSSAVSNLLSAVLRDQFSADTAYWKYPAQTVFAPLNMRNAVLETDASGTFIASSYLWARPRDWAKFGWMLLNDGNWQGRQILPAGWLALASSSTTQPDGSRAPYGAHVWQTHDPSKLSCASGAALPEDGLLLSGHWGQAVGIFPARKTVIVRTGWTTDKSQWDSCAFFNEILATIR